MFVFSGEFHPYRLPVPGLWLDVFQKVKALGFNAVSFYSDWALLEGQPGNYTAEGVFAFEPFFEAAQQAGIYLIARPGPVYIRIKTCSASFANIHSTSMPNQVEEASRAGFSALQGSSEPELRIIWPQRTTISPTSAKRLQRRKLQMVAP